jgi:hypothetical protein
VQPLLITLQTMSHIIAEIKSQLAHGGALLNLLYAHQESLGGYVLESVVFILLQVLFCFVLFSLFFIILLTVVAFCCIVM